jgi:hypothetical protein
MHRCFGHFCPFNVFKVFLLAVALFSASESKAELTYRFVSYQDLQSGGILDGIIRLPDDFLDRDPTTGQIASSFHSGFEWSAISSAGESISVTRDAAFKSVGVTYGSVSVTESAIVISPPPAFDTGSLFFEEIVYADGFRVETRMLLYTLSKNPSLNRFTAYEFITHANGGETVNVLWRAIPPTSYFPTSGWVIAVRVPEPSTVVSLLLCLATASFASSRAVFKTVSSRM